jgi:predicted  nucleic acid-binding Zn-ribbon protein
MFRIEIQVMNVEGSAARKARKLRASRDRWKQRSAEKQQQIRQLRVTNRDLSISREHWKQRVKDLEQQLQAWQGAPESHPAVVPGIRTFLGGLLDKRETLQTVQTPLSMPSD